MKIIRMCDQNKLAAGTNKTVGPFSLEALVITEFLMKIRGICDQNKLATTESSQNFYAFLLEALVRNHLMRDNDYIVGYLTQKLITYMFITENRIQKILTIMSKKREECN